MLKRSDGKTIKKTKDEDIIKNLYADEKKKQDSDRGEKIMNAFDVLPNKDKQMTKVKVSDLYAAPSNKEWNSFPKLSPDKEYELHQSIVDGGLMTPIIVWEITKECVKDLYKDNVDEYDFSGSKYMIIAGHSRTNAFIKLYNETHEEQYLYIDAIVRKDLTQDAAKYIIKVTNYVNRELSTKEKRESMIFMHRTLNENKTKGMNVAKKIAKDSGSALRTVAYQIAISEKLISEFIEMYDNKIITQGNAVKLTRLTKNMQSWMYETYGEKINNNSLKKLQKSFHKKEQMENIFNDKNDEYEYVNINIEVPKKLENKFRKMVENWKLKNI